MMDFWEVAYGFDKSGIAFAVVTLISTRGHAPQNPGAKAIVTAEGLRWGTVGGGKVEARAIEHARELLGTGVAVEPELLTWNLQRDIGMTCGGEVTYLFECHAQAAWKIVVFGAGHVGQALVRALAPLECRIHCIDPRTEWLEKLPQSPKLSIVCSPEPATLVEKLAADSYFVVMTQGHATDTEIVEALLRRFPEAPYIGVIGSDVKTTRLRADLRARGVSEAALSRLRAPIGLPIGGNHPAEIAISVVAELLQVRDNADV